MPPALARIDRHHRNQIDALFGPNPPTALIDPSMKFLFVGFTNRCGSNFLAHLIASTGILNVAEESFNASAAAEHVRRHGLRSLHDYVNFLCRRLNMSGWLITKVAIEQLVMLAESGVLDQIIGRSKIILIERQDRAAQAVSRLVAAQNQQWTSEQTPVLSDTQLVYSRAALDQQCAEVDFQNQAFYSFLAANGLVPMHLAYEALIESPQRHLDEIGAWLGFDRFIGDPAGIGIRRQESALKRNWRARYTAGG